MLVSATTQQVALRVKRRAFELLRIRPYREDMADGIQVLRYHPGQARFFPRTRTEQKQTHRESRFPRAI